MDAAIYTTPDPELLELLAARPALRADAIDGLCFEDVPLAAIAAEHATPCWVMGIGTLKGRARALRAAFADAGLSPSIHFALKSNDLRATLVTLAAEGFGCDAVSGGEIRRARAAGIAPHHIVFSGVGKTDAELDLALELGLAHINVESAEELRRLSVRASAMGREADVVLRVNPDVDAATHDKISTGRADDKFGIPFGDIPALFDEGSRLPGLRMAGLAVHIGSQINEAVPFRRAYARIASLVRDLRARGQAVHIVDCGGGLGIAYRDEIALDPRAWAATIAEAFGELDVRLAIEPGRWLSAPAGLLLARVIDTKAMPGGSPDLIVLDAAMNDLARPSLYDSWHGIVPVAPFALHAPCTPHTVVGPVCESSDVLARARPLPRLEPETLVAILDAGAYGAVMSSTYNSRPLASQVVVDDGRMACVKPRQDIEALWAGETVPEWFTA